MWTKIGSLAKEVKIERSLPTFPGAVRLLLEEDQEVFNLQLIWLVLSDNFFTGPTWAWSLKEFIRQSEGLCIGESSLSYWRGWCGLDSFPLSAQFQTGARPVWDRLTIKLPGTCPSRASWGCCNNKKQITHIETPSHLWRSLRTLAKILWLKKKKNSVIGIPTPVLQTRLVKAQANGPQSCYSSVAHLAFEVRFFWTFVPYCTSLVINVVLRTKKQRRGR